MALNHRTLVAIIAIATLPVLPAWAEDDVLEVHQQGDIFYVSGGIGQDETDALRAIKETYSLRILNADKTGHFAGDTRIIISDLQHNVLLDDTSGPLFYANLPKGKYIVEGFMGEESKKQIVTITGKKPVRVRFMWPQDIAE